MPKPLLSEALRGHGAVLRDLRGEQFVDELAPRDVVSRAMTARMQEQGTDHLWLDATGLERFDERFPTIAASLQAVGLDPATDWLPIAPAAHYLSGGVVTDLDGASSLPGLWACGEAACTGVHGANRLASNSLLEGMVFAPRVIEAIAAGKEGPTATGAMRAVLGGETDIGACRVEPGGTTPWDAGPSAAENVENDAGKARERIQRAMTTGAGVVRDAESLAATAGVLDATSVAGETPAWQEVRNLAEVGRALVATATAREESRGAHTRTDHPATSDAFRCRLVIHG
jgi:L-aspartate oxidase